MGHPSVTFWVTQVFQGKQLITALGDRYDRSFRHVTLYARARAGVKGYIGKLGRMGHHGHPAS
jgi:hypothetical protein